MSAPYETDERLKNYLDTHQVQRERMCLAILALDKRFSDVRPRHPRGGPDGGRDIEARFRKDLVVFGAVGFVNQATDSDDKKKEIKSKFLSDLASALSSETAPAVFVFLCNVNLTVGEKSDLIAIAKGKGLTECEIFDRERLRITLDSPDGLAIRFQYLAMPLSEAEQASFFARWGDDIQSVISTGFQQVQGTLDQLLFLQEAHDPISSFVVRFELDNEYSAETIGHFRAFCSLYLKEPKLHIFSLLFGSSDKSERFRKDISSEKLRTEPAGIKHGISGAQWIQHWENASEASVEADTDEEADEEEKFVQNGSSSSVGADPVRAIVIHYRAESFFRLQPTLTLKDFDGCMFLPYLNHALAKRVKKMDIISNGYILAELSSDMFSIDETSFDPNIPTEFSSSELADPWVRLRPKRASAFDLSFADVIPVRMFTSRQASERKRPRGS